MTVKVPTTPDTTATTPPTIKRDVHRKTREESRLEDRCEQAGHGHAEPDGGVWLAPCVDAPSRGAGHDQDPVVDVDDVDMVRRRARLSDLGVDHLVGRCRSRPDRRRCTRRGP